MGSRGWHSLFNVFDWNSNQTKTKMKKIFQLIVLMSALVVWQGCGSKAKEEAKEAAAQKELAAQEAAAKREAVIARRARIEKARLEKVEQRNLAWAQLYKTTLTYADGKGRIIYNKAEVNPSYTGGEEAMMKYLKDNLVYPQSAIDKGVEGTVYVDFVVGRDGIVTDVQATDAVWEDTDESLKTEAVRIVSSMPGWVAGRHRGRAVDTRFSIPITFSISE